MLKWLARGIVNWLVHEHERDGLPRCNFERLRQEIRPCDVVLVEGRTRVSDAIKNITQSIWTHSALYIGRLRDITDPALRAQIEKFWSGDPNEDLLIEALLGQGTIITPLSKYAKDHIRICRPSGLSFDDAQVVVQIAARHLGTDYDIRQMLDLARLMFPYDILPRRWRSSLFEHNVGQPTRTVCSTMIADAFAAVHFPVLPVVHRTPEGNLRLYHRNTRLYTPRDFDYSPYFDIIKYPLIGLGDHGVYRQLPWDSDGRVCNDEKDCDLPLEANPHSGVVMHANRPMRKGTRRFRLIRGAKQT